MPRGAGMTEALEYRIMSWALSALFVTGGIIMAVVAPVTDTPWLGRCAALVAFGAAALLVFG